MSQFEEDFDHWITHVWNGDMSFFDPDLEEPPDSLEPPNSGVGTDEWWESVLEEFNGHGTTQQER